MPVRILRGDLFDAHADAILATRPTTQAASPGTWRANLPAAGPETGTTWWMPQRSSARPSRTHWLWVERMVSSAVAKRRSGPSSSGRAWATTKRCSIR